MRKYVNLTSVACAVRAFTAVAIFAFTNVKNRRRVKNKKIFRFCSVLHCCWCVFLRFFYSKKILQEKWTRMKVYYLLNPKFSSTKFHHLEIIVVTGNFVVWIFDLLNYYIAFVWSNTRTMCICKTRPWTLQQFTFYIHLLCVCVCCVWADLHFLSLKNFPLKYLRFCMHIMICVRNNYFSFGCWF